MLRALSAREFCDEYGVGLTKFYDEVKKGRLCIPSHHPRNRRLHLFVHFGINPSTSNAWQQLAVQLALHHVPGTGGGMPFRPADSGSLASALV